MTYNADTLKNSFETQHLPSPEKGEKKTFGEFFSDIKGKIIEKAEDIKEKFHKIIGGNEHLVEKEMDDFDKLYSDLKDLNTKNSNIVYQGINLDNLYGKPNFDNSVNEAVSTITSPWDVSDPWDVSKVWDISEKGDLGSIPTIAEESKEINQEINWENVGHVDNVDSEKGVDYIPTTNPAGILYEKGNDIESIKEGITYTPMMNEILEKMQNEGDEDNSISTYLIEEFLESVEDSLDATHPKKGGENWDIASKIDTTKAKVEYTSPIIMTVEKMQDEGTENGSIDPFLIEHFLMDVKKSPPAKEKVDWGTVDRMNRVEPIKSKWENYTPLSEESRLGVFGGLIKVSENLGSNDGGLYKDAEGNDYYVKFYGDPTQACVETISNSIYEHLGIYAPKSEVGIIGNKTAYISKMIKGHKRVRKEDLKNSYSVKKGFVADAFLANWDVVGLVFDNLEQGSNGRLYRIDNGGTLIFRAQGGLKEFGPNIPELESLLNPDINPSSAFVFEGLTKEETKKQAQYLVDKLSENDIRNIVSREALPEELKDHLINNMVGRRNFLINKFNLETTNIEGRRNTIEKDGISGFTKALEIAEFRRNYERFGYVGMRGDSTSIEGHQIQIYSTDNGYSIYFKTTEKHRETSRKTLTSDPNMPPVSNGYNYTFFNSRESGSDISFDSLDIQITPNTTIHVAENTRNRLALKGAVQIVVSGENGKIISGLSTMDDFGTGGSGSAFARLVPKEVASGFYLTGGYTLVINPEVLNRTDWYAYENDRYGSIEEETFSLRSSPDEFVDNMKRAANMTNEVMFRRGIDPKMFTGICTKYLDDRDRLIEEIRNSLGVEEINGIPLEDFVVHAGETMEKFFDVRNLNKKEVTTAE